MVEGMVGDVKAMQSTRLTAVVGEQRLVGALQKQLDLADAAVDELRSAPAARAPVLLDQLEGAMTGPIWETGVNTARDLKSRRAAIDEQVRMTGEEYSSLRLNFDRLARAARRADAIYFDGATRQRKLAADVEGQLRVSDRDMRAGNLDNVAVAVHHAKALLAEAGLASRTDERGTVVVDAARLDKYSADFEEQVARAEKRDLKMTRRSELFVISGAATDLTLPYKVLLRRPGHGDTQETNLYDDVEVLLTDQDLFRETINEISENALDGIRSAAVTEPTAPPPGANVEEALAALRRAQPARTTTPGDLLSQLDSRSRLEQIGRRMYSLLIPDAMQRLIRETDDFPLTITSNNPELPWELLHDGEQFLCLRRMFARMPAGQTFPRRAREPVRPAEARQVRVLLVHSECDDLPLAKARTEIDEIARRLSAMRPEPEVTLLSGPDVNCRRLTDELSLGSFDIIHYAGHAGFDSQRPHLSYLLLTSGEKFRAERIQRLLEGHPVVFLNACESSRAAPQTTGVPTGSTVAQAQGLGSAFVYGGAQACVGSLWPVFDDTAAQLAITFYEQLIDAHQRVGEALRVARLTTYDARADAITWAAYALYGDPTYRLGAPVTMAWSPGP